MSTVLRILTVAALVWMGLQIVLLGIRARVSPLGRPPIPRPAFLLAKICAGISFFLLLWSAVIGAARLSIVSAVFFLILLVGGTLVFTLGIWSLGESLRMGLPNEKTTLVESGIYRYSRNPIYLGLYWVMFASLVYAFSWLNLAAAATAIILHHRIVLAEEGFLEQGFEGFEAYRNKVRRYL